MSKKGTCMNETQTEEKREFLRIEHEIPLNFKVLRGEKLLAKADVFSRNISACGVLFRTCNESSIPALSSIVWLELDEKIMNVCQEIERDLVIYKSGVFGRVVRIAEGEPNKSYDVGVCFLRKATMSDDEVQVLMFD